MRIETSRRRPRSGCSTPPASTSSHPDLLAQLVPLVGDAIEPRRAGARSACGPTTEEALRHLPGRAPVELDRAGPPESAEHRVAGRPWPPAGPASCARSLTAAAAGRSPCSPSTSAVSTASDGSFWTELDAAMNVALADLPVTLTCFFPELPLHLRILDGARRNHQLLLPGRAAAGQPGPPRPAGRARRAARRPPRSLLGPPDLRLRVRRMAAARDAARPSSRPCWPADYQREHAEDVVLAVNEVATNAVEHGDPGGRAVPVWTGPDELVCEVTTGAFSATRCPACRRRIRPTRRDAASGSPASSVTRCTSGPTRRHPRAHAGHSMSTIRMASPVTPSAARAPEAVTNMALGNRCPHGEHFFADSARHGRLRVDAAIRAASRSQQHHNLGQACLTISDDLARPWLDRRGPTPGHGARLLHPHRGGSTVPLGVDARRLVAYLAIHPRPQARAALAADLWPNVSGRRRANARPTRWPRSACPGCWSTTPRTARWPWPPGVEVDLAEAMRPACGSLPEIPATDALDTSLLDRGHPARLDRRLDRRSSASGSASCGCTPSRSAASG